MILRALTLAGGLMGAAASSQFPEYSQQYTQRLGGAVDALAEVVADFDASAATVGLSRDEALAQMTGTAFLDRRRIDMQTTFARHARLQDDLVTIQNAGPFMRAYHASRLTDGQIAQAAFAAYQPALPLNFAGVTFAGAGFVAGAGALGLVLRLLSWPFRRRPGQDAKAA
ncbi:DUF2937 family protein [uncultured Sulfitobacter sp.]|uniref:DUF2937 family protein n=1 Tax=uncultured Sulfitobacter sp. TaxID=191468 RepID=UPI0026099ED4|nr:DUF2937 family protein [uncultured Sulfitobacter sp.]